MKYYNYIIKLAKQYFFYLIDFTALNCINLINKD